MEARSAFQPPSPETRIRSVSDPPKGRVKSPWLWPPLLAALMSSSIGGTKLLPTLWVVHVRMDQPKIGIANGVQEFMGVMHVVANNGDLPTYPKYV